MRRIIRTNGTVQDLDHPMTFASAVEAIGAKNVDYVRMKTLGEPATIMVMDDDGLRRKRPQNHLASEMYRAQCNPGTPAARTVIYGDVYVCPVNDFGDHHALRM